jgi:hypothetical protein
MRAGAPASKGAAGKNKRPQDKYSGYVSWSDLDDASEEGEEEDGYGSDASSDMEGGFDEMEREEFISGRQARKEDEKALAEEEKLKREKEARRKRLEMMNKAAAGGRKKF